MQDKLVTTTNSAEVHHGTPERALDLALALARWNFAVFPLFAGKRPGAGSRGHLDASTNAAAIRGLWRRFPGTLVGYATGAASGVDVLDVDLGKHRAARWWWHRYYEHFACYRAYVTPSGGLHIWLRHALGLRCSQSRIFTGIDVRADAGFAVAWWLHGCPLHQHGRLLPWPSWLLSQARPREPLPLRPPLNRSPSPGADADNILSARIAGVLSVVSKAPGGARNNTVYWAACRFAEFVKAGQIGRADAERLLLDAARSIGVEVGEAQRTIRSAFWRGGVS
ncbi:bifunctional DNA primase/polymerase [Roseomonas terrae]|uniref:Bifunctional DNA primase/polymerase n=1 Tax=Neoroseomonas terrae TaxID=424799 RepID=A0ABS5ELZ8_9PROT|nr:bifunctional DNA primase/polymerase [Neoroseomonas terrae]MBR0652061.1 bifunctional DNA primase/polymerase [Neoroseomonas terrae]